ncbi:hypothetical protein NEOLEDRAFT_1177499 [Neolentinus lepideus HHB14362 ss-1]|uniref:NAD(P)-binding protein n=1 Tax=Neolentinus lepideus HHB14362 ss-1 TaxID=1314782 RepID=A0A165TD98_9AGAM|nr:hypothetical protein NEOLEDRAFT_1177499 [Neolentinus lepideus HHB14362 ss-1]
MSATLGKPSAIILGGLNTCSRALAAYLVPLESEPLVSHLRIVDKYSVYPPTTYLGPDFPKVLEKPNVEYRQANLTLPEIVSQVFDQPEGQAPYTYVFDITGEPRHDRPDQVQVTHTFQIGRLVAQEAARRSVKAYVRLTHAFYVYSEKGPHTEKQDFKPDGLRGIWWHETLRSIAAIPDLPVVILTDALVYGPYITFGYIPTFLCAAAVYGYIKQPLKAIHSPGTYPVHTVHIDDVVAAAWACAEWIAKVGRQEANTLAGESINFHNDKSVLKEVEGIVPPEQKIVAPVFNIVDDCDTSFVGGLRTMCALFGTTVEFHGRLTDVLAKFRLDDVVEDINEEHVSGWTKMLQSSNPPIQSTPLTPYVDKTALEKRVVALDNSKIKGILGLKLRRPNFDEQSLGEAVDKWKAEKVWPVFDQL